MFADPFVLTGAVDKSEIDGRSTHGFNLFVPPGLDEEAIKAAGLTMLCRQNRTGAVAEIGARWHATRLRRAAVLKREDTGRRSKSGEYELGSRQVAAVEGRINDVACVQGIAAPHRG
ncbi:MAG: hypothetical protein L0210_14555 [Rhodospirillales bacterium]|nr:hypothetical protein [Rhodospirillales bacterium]